MIHKAQPFECPSEIFLLQTEQAKIDMPPIEIKASFSLCRILKVGKEKAGMLLMVTPITMSELVSDFERVPDHRHGRKVFSDQSILITKGPQESIRSIDAARSHSKAIKRFHYSLKHIGCAGCQHANAELQFPERGKQSSNHCRFARMTVKSRVNAQHENTKLLDG